MILKHCLNIGIQETLKEKHREIDFGIFYTTHFYYIILITPPNFYYIGEGRGNFKCSLAQNLLLVTRKFLG